MRMSAMWLVLLAFSTHWLRAPEEKARAADSSGEESFIHWRVTGAMGTWRGTWRGREE